MAHASTYVTTMYPRDSYDVTCCCRVAVTVHTDFIMAYMTNCLGRDTGAIAPVSRSPDCRISNCATTEFHILGLYGSWGGPTRTIDPF